MADQNCKTYVGGCASCSGCDTGEERKPSFFDRLEQASERFEEIGEDKMISMLNDLVTALEEEELREESLEQEAKRAEAAAFAGTDEATQP